MDSLICRPGGIKDGFVTRLVHFPYETRHLVAGAALLLHSFPPRDKTKFWGDRLHGYFHGLFTADIALRMAGSNAQNPLFVKGLVLASLFHDVTAHRGRADHPETGGNLVAGACVKFPFWKPVKEGVKRAILTHEGRPPYPKPETFLAALLHDADRLQEITDVDRIIELSREYQRLFFDSTITLEWRIKVLSDRSLRDHKKNDNLMYFLDNLNACFRRKNYITERAYREGLRIRPFVVERMKFHIDQALVGSERISAHLLLDDMLSGSF